MKHFSALVCALGLAGLTLTGCAKPRTYLFLPTPPQPVADRALADVVLVGNNWDGTVTVLDPVSFQTIKVVNVVPDKQARLDEITGNPGRRIVFALISRFVGENNDQLVDDVFLSKDGRFLFASRPSFADVVAVDLETGTLAWRTTMAGLRADHAAISPDGETLLVSDSTKGRVHAIATRDGHVTGGFDSGDEPHESNYSKDGNLIYHASIGRVFLSRTSKLADRLKGKRVFQIVDATTYKVLKRFDMRQKAEEAGLAWKAEALGLSRMDAAVRPMAVTDDGRRVFLQMSFLHGFYEFDLVQEKMLRRADLPVPDDVAKKPLSEYQLNSAHHGITLSGDERKLCVAGTMSGYAAIVARDDTFTHTRVEVGAKPYWATTSADGTQCYVSVSAANQMVVISFEDGSVVRRVDVGLHPQRIRTGRMSLPRR